LSPGIDFLSFEKMASRKRKGVVIDLTDEEPLPKVLKSAQPHSFQSAQDSSSQLAIVIDSDDSEEELEEVVQHDIGEGWIKYGSMDEKIVGTQYYKGRTTIGEQVILKREPSNQYDANAIRVDNMAHQQIGHIPRRHAAKIAPFMDDNSLLVEGIIIGIKGLRLPHKFKFLWSSGSNFTFST
jgi:SWI/SNF-related matrix-associated actin-dependent regulator of chromatin subfamily A3